MTGASGLVGRALCAALASEGIAFSILSRDPRRAARTVPGAMAYERWQTVERGTPWRELMTRTRAVVHLASPLARRRRRGHAGRQELYDSCVVGTRGMVSAMAQARDSRPEALISASCVAFYGFHGDDESWFDEEAPAGEDYLARLVADWEAAALHAEEFGVRTVVLRLGLVLGPRGALPRLRWAARLGLGGWPGRWRHRQPWVHVEDVVGLIRLALGDERARGPLNAVAPGTVSGGELLAALRAEAGIPAGLPAPAVLRRGVPALAVTEGRGAAPARALALGYEFQRPNLAMVLGPDPAPQP